MFKGSIGFAAGCIAILGVSGAYASTDWDELRRDPRNEILAPKLELRSEGFRRPFVVSVLETCRDGERIRSIAPNDVCLRHESPYDGVTPPARVCRQPGQVYPETPIHTVKTVCLKYDYEMNYQGYWLPVCVKSEEQRYTIPLQYSIRINQYNESATYYGRTLNRSWEELFEIPVCDAIASLSME